MDDKKLKELSEKADKILEEKKKKEEKEEKKRETFIERIRILRRIIEAGLILEPKMPLFSSARRKCPYCNRVLKSQEVECPINKMKPEKGCLTIMHYECDSDVCGYEFAELV